MSLPLIPPTHLGPLVPHWASASPAANSTYLHIAADSVVLSQRVDGMSGEACNGMVSDRLVPVAVPPCY